ncbi:hypothetical protein Glove_199g33 [Diversispora epigaea]|uniref:Uncharacterized protein n=1 Tax=Diversispora epigaea TaxID=1348612 RepID=A0A397IPT5_9GLOM|nr:hypothetical protein Glove_199g33 [Diversispora epigaea]
MEIHLQMNNLSLDNNDDSTLDKQEAPINSFGQYILVTELPSHTNEPKDHFSTMNKLKIINYQQQISHKFELILEKFCILGYLSAMVIFVQQMKCD